ncbi:hypothetical protein C2E20_2167 [Micractinium conductrix]|uniref:Uncharacterized protein n=1 Tax=Micractinium conductrix TaxID=554055 RepID=A0A2P6VKL7_9CHLO|nr:hypothetical protein C2E20_2167 [Micractinium conductrix]|eukprot:PSC74607.1 hypothetical protein C2E20_2167 [Micractinium conductrix]
MDWFNNKKNKNPSAAMAAAEAAEKLVSRLTLLRQKPQNRAFAYALGDQFALRAKSLQESHGELRGGWLALHDSWVQLAGATEQLQRVHIPSAFTGMLFRLAKAAISADNLSDPNAALAAAQTALAAHTAAALEDGGQLAGAARCYATLLAAYTIYKYEMVVSSRQCTAVHKAEIKARIPALSALSQPLAIKVMDYFLANFQHRSDAAIVALERANASCKDGEEAQLMASNPLLSSQFELHEQEGYAWSTPQARRCNVFKAFKDGIAPLLLRRDDVVFGYEAFRERLLYLWEKRLIEHHGDMHPSTMASLDELSDCHAEALDASVAAKACNPSAWTTSLDGKLPDITSNVAGCASVTVEINQVLHPHQTWAGEVALRQLGDTTAAIGSSPSLGNVQAASHAAKLASDAASSAELARQIEELQLPLTTKQPVKDAAAGAVAAGIEAATEPPRLTLQQLQQACHVLVDQQDSCIYGAHINLRAETAVGVPHRLLTAGELRELQAALQHSAAALLELGPGSPKAVCMATVAQDTCVPSDAPSGHYAAQARGFLRAFNLARDQGSHFWVAQCAPRAMLAAMRAYMLPEQHAGPAELHLLDEAAAAYQLAESALGRCKKPASSRAVQRLATSSVQTSVRGVARKQWA